MRLRLFALEELACVGNIHAMQVLFFTLASALGRKMEHRRLRWRGQFAVPCG